MELVDVDHPERADERRPQLGQEVQRAAEEDHLAADRVAAGQAGDGLGGDGLEDRGGDVGVRGALVEQRYLEPLAGLVP
jgi:hypothetical protein